MELETSSFAINSSLTPQIQGKGMRAKTKLSTSRGSLYVFEGPDGVGKSELAKLLFRTLKESFIDCDLVTFPGREPGTLGKLVYSLHHAPAELGVHALSATALQAMHIAAHIDVIEARILPALKAGKTIILDRYWWSTRVYGFVGGANKAAIEELIKAELLSWSAVNPTAVFLIRRKQPLRDEPMREWRRWCSAYKKLSVTEAQSYCVRTIDNDQSIDDALKQIVCEVDLHLHRK